MTAVRLHNLKFYKPKPNPISIISFNSQKQILALARLNASIEIWNVKDAPFIEKVLAFNSENYSIEDLGWFQDRLFSVGLHGFILEYDIVKCTILYKSSVTGEAAYCMDIHEKNKQIAVGTEQGYLNIFNIEGDSLIYNKFFDKQEGRILCLKFHSSGLYIASGGLDAIRIWDVQTGHALHRMTTGRAEANKVTIVWCLAFNDDFSVISGDSRGKLTFWDSKAGAQLESFQTHKADILSLTVNEDQSNLYCSGIDPNILKFEKIELKGGKEKWVRSQHRKFQDHDVRSLVLNGNKLFSGGSSAYLIMSTERPMQSIKYLPILQNPIVTLSKDARLVLLRHPKHIEICGLAESNDLSKEHKPRRIMILQKLVKNHEGVEVEEGITFASLSDDGQWIAYGTRLGLKVYQIDSEDELDTKLLNVQIDSSNDGIYMNGVFTPDNSQLITAFPGGVVIYEISNDCVAIAQRLDGEGLNDTINILKVSPDGKYFVATDTASNIVLWKKQANMSWKFYCKLPKYSCAPLTLDIHPIEHNIIIAYSDSKIVEYSIKKKEFTKLSKNLPDCLHSDWSSRFYPIRNIFYNIASEKIVLHDDNSLMTIGKQAQRREKKRKLNGDAEATITYSLKIVQKYKYLIYAGMLSKDEMVIVELPPSSLEEKLPPTLVLNKFGRK
ncbi:U3 small nucleolar RNA-associated protein 4 homolog [Harmonia axyridis]|uniref:U3 small nucleolar RNA-associated protein 4 homolog n=1 Tax=Harmonia axyridis TaxID=115357 RepID=UPI001E277F2F|nr:U3 small nucleolar RNA-associated protein 4 homolog [Harmonia axyridis]